MAKIKIQIKSIFGDLLFEHEKENNTIKDTVEEAVRQNVSLNGASLDGASLYGASLDGASLYGALLNGASLDGASLDGALLNGASLYRASLAGASLNGASLYGASLNGALLNGASLNGASLDRASLDGASLNGASLYGASLYRASLNGAENIPYIPFTCPSDGAFIGWKKVSGHLIKLEIPEDARRCSATSNKCRCDKAKVLAITDITTGTERKHITNTNYAITTYTVGKMVYPDSFDENRWNECSNGIHFFINKQDAINY